MVIYGFTAVLSNVWPIPFTNNANRNIGKLIHLAAGIINNIPVAIKIKERSIDFLYPTLIRILPDGIPKSKNAEKVAVVTRYDFAVLMLNAALTKGTKNAFIPTAKPKTENMEAIIRIGRTKPFHFSLSFFVFIYVLFI